MAGINFIGSYSGMDQSVIDKLMAVEKRPLTLMTQKKSAIESQKSAWKDVMSRLDNLMEKLKSLSKEETYYSRTLSSSDSAKLSVSGGTDAPAGSYEVKITRLATRSTLTGTPMTEKNPDVALGLSGSLTLSTSETSTATIQIEANQSLRTIVRSINRQSQASGVEASVIDGRLVLSAANYGSQAITAESTDNGVLENLGLQEGNLSLGLQSQFSVNGHEMVRETNTITDAVLGMTLQLKSATGESEFLEITVTEDQDKAVEAFKAFVEQYNSTVSFLKTQTAAGTKEVAGSQGKLYGENALVRLQSALRQAITSNFTETASGMINLSEIGLTTADREGTLKLDDAKFRKAFAENPQSIHQFFSDTVEEPSAEGPVLTKVGMGVQLEALVLAFTDKSKGTIAGKNQTIERAIRDLNRRMEAFEEKMLKKEAYYVDMFSKLDVALQKSEAQANWLSAQLGGMQST